MLCYYLSIAPGGPILACCSRKAAGSRVQVSIHAANIMIRFYGLTCGGALISSIHPVVGFSPCDWHNQTTSICVVPAGVRAARSGRVRIGNAVRCLCQFSANHVFLDTAHSALSLTLTLSFQRAKLSSYLSTDFVCCSRLLLHYSSLFYVWLSKRDSCECGTASTSVADFLGAWWYRFLSRKWAHARSFSQQEWPACAPRRRLGTSTR
jgi:hypothetical protein